MAGAEAGFFTIGELKERLPDGQPKITLDDVCDVNEYLDVKDEIERRANQAIERKQQLKMAHPRQ